MSVQLVYRDLFQFWIFLSPLWLPCGYTVEWWLMRSMIILHDNRYYSSLYTSNMYILRFKIYQIINIVLTKHARLKLLYEKRKSDFTLKLFFMYIYINIYFFWWLHLDGHVEMSVSWCVYNFYFEGRSLIFMTPKIVNQILAYEQKR